MRTKISCVYKIVNTINGKLYVGSSMNFLERKKIHLRNLRKGKSSSYHLQSAFSKYGESSFLFEILEIVNKEDLLAREEEWILKLESNNPEKGYNTRLPLARDGHPASKSDSLKDHYNKNVPKSLKVISPEEWMRRRTENPEFSVRQLRKGGAVNKGKRVVGVSADGAVLSTHESIRKACQSIGKKDSYLNNSLRINALYTKFSKTLGYYWFLEEEYDSQRFLEVLNKPKPKRVYKRNRISGSRATTPISLKNYFSREVVSFPAIAEAARWLSTPEAKLYALKRGFENKGKGRIVKINKIKGWMLA